MEVARKCARVFGRTPPGVRGLKFEVYRQEFADISRTPPGVRGLKSLSTSITLKDNESHPTRGAWIEISDDFVPTARKCGRTPPGVRGLKFKRDVRSK